jgi:hypothetical protein
MANGIVRLYREKIKYTCTCKGHLSGHVICTIWKVDFNLVALCPMTSSFGIDQFSQPVDASHRPMRRQTIPRTERDSVLPPNPPCVRECLLGRKGDGSKGDPRRRRLVPFGRGVFDRLLGRVRAELGAERVDAGVGGLVFLQMGAVERGGRARGDALALEGFLVV